MQTNRYSSSGQRRQEGFTSAAWPRRQMFFLIVFLVSQKVSLVARRRRASRFHRSDDYLSMGASDLIPGENACHMPRKENLLTPLHQPTLGTV
jgi:hypothetical protein